jgi:predicted esterase
LETNLETFYIPIEKSTRVFTYGKLESSKEIWILLHGYGQLGSKFLNSFLSSDFKRADIFLVVPEGAHRFYWGGFSGPPVASWMTSEMRNFDILENTNYLNTVYDKFYKENIPISVLGFSQGCATALRWLNDSQKNIQHLVLWSGIFPEDIDYNLNSEYWSKIKLTQIFGNEDPFITQERKELNEKIIRDNNLEINYLYFFGGHEIKPDLFWKELV